MEPIEAWGTFDDVTGRLEVVFLDGSPRPFPGDGKTCHRISILPNLTASDWTSLMALVRMADDCSFGPVLDLPPAIIAAAREGR